MGKFEETGGKSNSYLGQPLAGLLTFKARSTAATQSPSIFRRSGSGPFITATGGDSLGFFFFGFVINSSSHNQTLSSRALNDGVCTVAVIHFPLVPAEVKLRQIARQMLFADGMVNTHQTALNQRKRAFRRVGINAPCTYS